MLFAHRLALELGEPDVMAMLDGMTLEQFRLWQGYFAIEPWGEERADLRMAIETSALVNMQIVRGRKTKPRDFMPNFDARPPAADEIYQRMLSFAQAHNAFIEGQ